jgi:hypothetical protein
MTPENFEFDRGIFERALTNVPVGATPLSTIRARFHTRHAALRMRRTVAASVVGVLIAFATSLLTSNIPVIAAMRAVLFPHRAATIIVLRTHGDKATAIAEKMQSVASLSDAQRHMPFPIAILLPESTLHFESAWISDAVDDPAVETLYKTRAGGWVKITQRRANAARTKRDAQIDDLVSSAPLKEQRFGSIFVSTIPHQASVTSERALGSTRATITAIGPGSRDAFRYSLTTRRAQQ